MYAKIDPRKLVVLFFLLTLNCCISPFVAIAIGRTPADSGRGPGSRPVACVSFLPSFRSFVLSLFFAFVTALKSRR